MGAFEPSEESSTDQITIHVKIPKATYYHLKRMGYSVTTLARLYLIKKASQDADILMDGYTFAQCMEAIGVTDFKVMRQYLIDLFDVPEIESPDNPLPNEILSRNGRYKLVGGPNLFQRVVKKVEKEV